MKLFRQETYCFLLIIFSFLIGFTSNPDNIIRVNVFENQKLNDGVARISVLSASIFIWGLLTIGLVKETQEDE